MTISLTCRASGADNLNYQWMRSGDKNIPSQANEASTSTQTLVIPNIGLGDSGEYKCVVSSGSASVTSEHGTVSVISEL